MSREQVEKLIQVAAEPERHGKWSQFCLDERVTKDEVFHWRKKLGLPMRGRPVTAQDGQAILGSEPNGASL